MEKNNLDRFQPAGPTWEERAKKSQLQAVLDPADDIGIRNRYIDLIHKTALSKHLKLNNTDIVCDFGCGTGRFTSLLAKKAFKVFGIDVTKEMLEAAKKNVQAENVEFIHYDGINIPFDDEYFDAIVSIGVLQHINYKKDFLKLTEELCRVLKKNKRIYLIEQVSAKDADYFIHKSLEDYIDAFKTQGAACVCYYPIGSGSGGLLGLPFFEKIVSLSYSRYFLPYLAKLDIFLSKSKKSIRNRYYMEYLFVFEKK